MFGEGFVLDLPRFFSIFGFQIYYYGLFITAGYALAALYLIKRRELLGLTKDNILDILIIAIPCGLVGARIYYMLFNIDTYFGPGNWGNIFMFREGGLAVYGGIIASGLVFIIYSRVKKIPLGSLLDAAGFGLFIGQAVGRWGNFFNREAFGVETNLPWRMGLTFHSRTYIASLDKSYPAGETFYFHPTFFYEGLWNIAGLVIMHIFSKKSRTKYPGQYFLFYVAWYGLGRFMIEGLRTDSLYIHGTGVRASQLLAVLSFLGAIAILVYNHIRGKNSESVYGEDAEDMEEAEDAKELAQLDGATDGEIADESSDVEQVDGVSAGDIENESEDDKIDEDAGDEDTETTESNENQENTNDEKKENNQEE